MTIQTQTFGTRLNNLREQRGLTVQELADKAGVRQTLISSLNTDSRVIGEKNARKIGSALGLSGEHLQSFIFDAINNCTERVLDQFKQYPGQVLNLTASILNAAGIPAEKIIRCVEKPDLGYTKADAAVYLNDGKAALIRVEITYA